MQEKNYLVFGKNVLVNLIKTRPNLIREVWIERGREKEIEILNNIKVTLKTIKEINLLTDENHQGFVAFMKEYSYLTFNDIKDDEQILILDRIQDPHNFGAIIRSAALFGYKSILMLDHNQCPITPVVVKTSAGALFNVKIARVSNLANALKILKENGHWIYATYLSDDSIDIEQVSFAEKNVIIIGNEGEGVAPKLAGHADYKIKINTTNAIDSLNASVATGITLFAATREKRTKNE